MNIWEYVAIPWCLQATRSMMCNCMSSLDDITLLITIADGVMAWAPSVVCLSVPQLIVIVIAAVGALISVILVPIVFVVVIRRQLVSPRSKDHEEFVHLKETEYVVCRDSNEIVSSSCRWVWKILGRLDFSHYFLRLNDARCIIALGN